MNSAINWTEAKGSSNIAGFAYIAGDPETDLGTLFIRFGSGMTYQYTDFPNQLAEDFFGADSKGKFFHANILGDYVGKRFISNELQDEAEETLEKGRDDLQDDLGEPEDLRDEGVLAEDAEVRVDGQLVEDDELGAYGQIAVQTPEEEAAELGDGEDVSENWGDEGPTK